MFLLFFFPDLFSWLLKWLDMGEVKGGGRTGKRERRRG